MTADRIAALEARIAWLEDLPEARTARRRVADAEIAVAQIARDAAAQERAAADRARHVAAETSRLNLVALELPPLRPNVTRVSLPVFLPNGTVTIERPGPALVVKRRDVEDEQVAHLVACGELIVREPTEAELQTYAAQHGR